MSAATQGLVRLPVWRARFVLGTLVNLTFSSADIVAVYLASAALCRLRQSGLAQRAMRWIGGATLIGLGAHMAASRN